MKRVLVPVNVAISYLITSDILSYRTPGLLRDPLGKCIAVAGRGEECHTATLQKDRGDAVVLGMRWGAQKLKLLVDEVIANPGLIDVYRLGGSFADHVPIYLQHRLPDYIRHDINDDMRRFALADQYGAASVFRSSFYFVPFVRLFTNPHPLQVKAGKRAPFCSMAVAMACANHWRPLLHNRNPEQILPGDIPTSPLTRYVLTLTKPAKYPHKIEDYFKVAA